MSHDLAGARGTIGDPAAVVRQAQAWATEHDAEVLLADARKVFGRDHLESAILHAERSRDAGTMATRSVAMEALLYLAGQRQVADAIRLAGIKKGTSAIALVVFGPASVEDFLRRFGWSRGDDVLAAEGKSIEALGITAAERDTVPGDRASDLALERAALVDVSK